MNRTELAKRLKAKGVAPAQMCRDFDISRSTYTRWKTVPGYAVAYLVAIELSDEGFSGNRWLMEFHHRIAVIQEETKSLDGS